MNTVIEESLPRRHRITADEYYRMGVAGLFEPQARMELIEGEIIDMAPIGDPHMAVVDWLLQLMIRAARDQAIVRAQGGVRLGDFSIPQPDIALLKPRQDFYSNRSAKSADTFLLIEVSDSTLSYDLGRKVPLYARYGIPEFWVFDIRRQQIHFFRSPQGEGYAEVSVVTSAGMTAISQLPNVTVDLSWFFAAQFD